MYESLKARLAERGLTIDAIKNTNRTNINAFLKTAIDENKVYVALTTPTATQQTKQIKALTKQTNKMIRLMLNLLDSAD